MNRQNKRQELRKDAKKQKQTEKSLTRKAIENNMNGMSVILTRMQIVQEAMLQLCFKRELFTLEEFQQAAAEFDEKVSKAIKAEKAKINTGKVLS